LNSSAARAETVPLGEFAKPERTLGGTLRPPLWGTVRKCSPKAPHETVSTQAPTAPERTAHGPGARVLLVVLGLLFSLTGATLCLALVWVLTENRGGAALVLALVGLCLDGARMLRALQPGYRAFKLRERLVARAHVLRPRE
jgi:hypothetical protein